MATIDLSIVIVNWNVAPLLRDCLASIAASPEARLDADGLLHLGTYTVEVYVVDNASSDGSSRMVADEFPWAHLIASEHNLGFSAGNNLALRRCSGRYALLLNPDTRVVNSALDSLLRYADSHPDVGVLGPQLRYGDGSPQSSRRRFPTLMTAFMESTLLEEWFPDNRWARAYHLADVPDRTVQDVDWVTGACMLVRRDVLERVGLLDEGYFMYSEELDWCRRITDQSWRIVYLPEAVVVHYEGQSSGQVVAARHIHFDSSKIRYFRKHHGPCQAAVLRLFLLLTYMVRLAEETAKFLLGHKRDLRRDRMVAYVQVLRSRLRPPPQRVNEAQHA